jgi:hypothetical protein
MSPQEPRHFERGKGKAGSQTSWFMLFFTTAAFGLIRYLIFALLIFVLLGALAHYAIVEHGVHILTVAPFLIVAVLLLAAYPLWRRSR